MRETCSSACRPRNGGLVPAAARGLLLGAALLLAGCATPAEQARDAALYRLQHLPLHRQRWHFEHWRGWVINSLHYRVFTTVSGRWREHLFVRVLEAAYGRFERLVPGAREPLPLDVYIFRRRRQWAAFTRRYTGQNATVYLDIAAGAYTQHGVAVAYWLGQDATLSVLAHEAWHQCSWFGFRNHLPAWLEEGLATQNEAIAWRKLKPYFVPRDNLERWRALRAAYRGHRLWTLHELLRVHAGEVVKLPQKDIDSYYAQLWSFTLYLERSRYRKGLLRLLHAARVGTLVRALHGTGLSPGQARAFTARWNYVAGPAYLHSFITRNTAELQQRYFAFVRRITAKRPAPLP
jgi:hypothetical protein